jgi:hypothetical protein
MNLPLIVCLSRGIVIVNSFKDHFRRPEPDRASCGLITESSCRAAIRE